jgi:hypothetical protein
MPQLRMLFWKASESFDHADEVIMDTKWREKYPEIYQVPPDPGSPFPVMQEPSCLLACYYHEEKYIPPTVERIAPFEALLRCGSESIFEAADSGASVRCGMLDKHIPVN